ncbi:hypothetical protein PI124_g6801 [Phytophthora idaei]|nr:hypothetical protein PI125_g7254 [Phytophthora idaei]KAG3160035.1 hypothetical protein PI126_g7080 [Phytophthora idaei]KAG3248511.1 hypothetical protein PI124_g6801 [Phytophthora idaei]
MPTAAAAGHGGVFGGSGSGEVVALGTSSSSRKTSACSVTVAQKQWSTHA